MQLSQYRLLDGIILLSKVQERDFIENKVLKNIIAIEERLELLSNIIVKDTKS
jgi:hypothetical protein